MDNYENRCLHRCNDCCVPSECNEEIQGPQGPQGLQGPQGPQGIRGERGPQGFSGFKGDPGCPGPAGPQGPAGNQGVRGPQGIRGDAGPKGDAGCIGPQGIQGAQGTVGPQGDRGPAGPQGDPGVMGPAGPTGEKGIRGERGPIGLRGPKGEQGIQGETGPQGLQGDVGCQGEQGEQGLRGITGLKGETGLTGPMPEITVGNVTSGGNASVTVKPSTEGAALDFVLPVGPAGPQGPQGSKGETGPRGDKGAVGPQGPMGQTPLVTVGNVSSGNVSKIIPVPTETGVIMDFVLPPGPTGPQGLQGITGPTGAKGPDGPQGLPGDMPAVAVGSVFSGENADITARPSETGVSLDFIVPLGPTGPRGLQGIKGVTGPRGEKGDTGEKGPVGAHLPVTIGNVVTGAEPEVTVNTTPTGAALDFVLPQIIGPAGEHGDKGAPGITGLKGDNGPAGPTGPAPKMTVTEDTPAGYKISFQTEDGDMATPNLKYTVDYHNTNLGENDSYVDIPMGKLILTMAHVSANPILVKASLRPADPAQPVLADIISAGVYNNTILTKSYDNQQISDVFPIDSTIYGNTSETYWMRIRQEDPQSKLWSLCEVRFLASDTNKRSTTCINWIYTDSSYDA